MVQTFEDYSRREVSYGEISRGEGEVAGSILD